MNQFLLFKQNLLKKPYCSNKLSEGLVIRDSRRALGFRYIQPNHPNSKLWLAYDIDRPTGVEELTDDIGVLAPHFFIQNPQNQHAHALYALETPVHFNPRSSKRAIRFAGALDAAMTMKMDADAGYCGLITKNPLHEHWRVWSTSAERYQLADLAEYLDLEQYGDLRRALPEVGLGRNCAIFEKLRVWAYRAIRQGWPPYDQFLAACLDRASGYSANLETPLPAQEIAHIAKSVAKYVHSRFSPASFSARQAALGQKGGRKSKRKPVEGSERSSKPWEKLGISRATYYRKK